LRRGAADARAADGVIYFVDGVLTRRLDVADVATRRGFSSVVMRPPRAPPVNAYTQGRRRLCPWVYATGPGSGYARPDGSGET
jgi:hypothetical protein